MPQMVFEREIERVGRTFSSLLYPDEMTKLQKRHNAVAKSQIKFRLCALSFPPPPPPSLSLSLSGVKIATGHHGTHRKAGEASTRIEEERLFAVPQLAQNTSDPAR